MIRSYNSPDSTLAKTNFQKKRTILKVVKRSALRKARSVPLFDAWRNSCRAQLLNFYTTPARLELGPVVSGRGDNADWSRGEFGFRAGRSVESPRVCSGGKRENP